MPRKEKPGPPSEYRPSYAARAEKLCRMGVTMEELAACLGKDERTIGRWRRRFDDFHRAIERGRAEYQARVAKEKEKDSECPSAPEPSRSQTM